MEIVPGIHQIDGVNGNCFIIVRDELTLIDTGMPKNSTKIITYIQDVLKRKPTDIKTIVLTHFHIDHVGGASELKKLSGAKVAIHKKDADYVSGRKTPPVPRGVKGMIVKVLIPLFFGSRPVEPDIYLNDGDTIAGLTTLHTPGHTPGSICLFDPVSKILFAGDLLRFDGTNIKMGPLNLDQGEEQKSINKIAAIDFDIMLSGHGIPLRPEASVKIREFAKRNTWKNGSPGK
ncbi:beta-lactamase domain protein [Methanoregula boonei 6A8]|uniref:Beta-lactamase domain protein n=1 Tax=Methanoregula boonei (strain DSM 21154 / JCM 14090 / 6A8) TaxID=456442 RepID=A7I596_METB6|nr:MBL fold metallo-hydrolase [Methanoregula boonei]ABS54907.1 beta-lactamase domain protein [Methanoregula boonei 6A8]